MADKFTWNNHIKVPNEGLMRASISMLMTQKAGECKAYMQINRPWTDRTGQAKRLLNAQFVDDGDILRIVLTQGVGYGLFLETKDGGKFGIIKPTIQAKGEGVIRSLQSTGLWEGV